MTYSVKEIYYTLQGEGAQTGLAAVFLRFSGCNLWTGQEADRAGAVCNFCDTDFLGTDGPGGGKFSSATELSTAVNRAWPEHVTTNQRWVVCTGGEPLLQLDTALIEALHAQGFLIAVETNGTVAAPSGIDWLCVSPKAGANCVQREGNELKIVYPQAGLNPEDWQNLAFSHFFLQPLAGPNLAKNQQRVANYCLEHPPWRVSLQIHKLLGLP